MILSNLDWTKILFLDIECVSEKKHFDELDERLQYLWHRKAKSLGALPKDLAEDAAEYQTALADSYREKAAIYAEFGKIICISVSVQLSFPISFNACITKLLILPIAERFFGAAFLKRILRFPKSIFLEAPSVR